MEEEKDKAGAPEPQDNSGGLENENSADMKQDSNTAQDQGPAVPEQEPMETPETHPDVSPVMGVANAIRENIAKVLVGQEEMVDLLLVGLLTEGHILLEGLPGIAKTMTAKLMAKSLSADFSRIQFTPDLMPTDITGTSVFSMKDSEFHFKKGPIFAQIVLIDEINRAPAKTQAALMEVMEERQLTYDGNRYEMQRPFLVVATQNPIEQEGTYALPEAQLDRFLFKVKVNYPSLQNEISILENFKDDYLKSKLEDISSVASGEDILNMSKIVEKVHIKRELIEYIANVVHNTRNNGDLFMGASPRASLAILRTSKAMAAIRGRGFVTPDDIKAVSIPVLNHRLILSHDREMEGITVEEVIKVILEEIEIPR